MRTTLIVLSLVALCAAPNSRAEVPGAAALPSLPEIPALVLDSPPPNSFVVDGVFRFSPRRELGFHVATDGNKQVCVVYDRSDGTPLFFCDGARTLVYDLANGRIALAPGSRTCVRVQWEAGAARPLSVEASVHAADDPADLKNFRSWFQLNRFVDASRPVLHRVETKDGTATFAAQREDAVESIQVVPGRTDWFRFSSLNRARRYYELELTVHHVDQRVPAEALAFPDVAQLARDVEVQTVDKAALPDALTLAPGVTTLVGKVSLVDDPRAVEGDAPKLPDGVKGELRNTDARLGPPYRAALARQGIRFPSRAAENNPSAAAPDR
jgi:hypothetical protein